MKYYALSQSLKNISRWWPDEWNVSTTVALAAAVLAIFAIAFLASRTGAGGSTQKRKQQQRNSVPITAEFAPNAGATPASTPASTPAPMQAPTPTPAVARTVAFASTVSPPAPSSKKEESPPPREPEPVVRQAAQPTASVSSPKQSVAAVSLSPETKTAASPARVETTAATPAKTAASSPSKVEPAVLPVSSPQKDNASPQKETAATPAKALSTEASPAKSSTAPAAPTMVDFLIKVAQLSHDDVSVALGYSGKNGARDVASFLEGRSKDAEERTAKLAVYYETQAQQWAVATVKQLTEQQGVSLAALSEALGYSGKNGARDVAAFVEGRSTDLEARRGRLVEFVTKVSTPVKATPQKEVPAAAAATASPTKASAETSVADAPSSAAAQIHFLTTVVGCSNSDVSVALGYSGKNGARDIAAFLEGRSKGAEERAAKFAEYYETQAQQWAVATVKHLTEQQGVSLAVLSEALGYSGKNGARDVAAFVEGRSTDLEARRGRLRELVDKQKQCS